MYQQRSNSYRFSKDILKIFLLSNNFKKSLIFQAPRASGTDEDLKKSVIEFLKQDKEFVTELEKMKLSGRSF